MSLILKLRKREERACAGKSLKGTIRPEGQVRKRRRKEKRVEDLLRAQEKQGGLGLGNQRRWEERG